MTSKRVQKRRLVVRQEINRAAKEEVNSAAWGCFYKTGMKCYDTGTAEGDLSWKLLFGSVEKRGKLRYYSMSA